MSPTRSLSGEAATLPAAGFTTTNTSEAGLYGTYSEIFFGNVGTVVLTVGPGESWNLGAVAAPGLSPTGLQAAFGTDTEADPQGEAAAGRFLYSEITQAPVRGAVIRDVAGSFTLELGNVPAFSGREYTVVPAGETVVDTEIRTGTRQVIVRGGGTLVLAGANTHTGGVKVEDGTLVVQSAGAFGTGTLEVGSGGTVNLDIGNAKATVTQLVVAADARLNLGVGGLTIAAGGATVSQVRSLIQSARGTGNTWDGYGITSSSASRVNRLSVGYRQLLNGTIQVAWAAMGDTNLDGRVNSSDIIALNSARRFNLPSIDGHWWQGDFTYDGKVNSSDISNLAAMFNKPSYYQAAATQAAATLFAASATETTSQPKSLSQQTFAAVAKGL